MKLIITGVFAIVASAQGPSPARELAANYGKLPLSFEANQGQTDASVKFVAHGAGYSIYLSSASATFSLERSDQAAVVRMDLVGANQAAGIEPQGKLPGIANYMIGAKRTTNIPTYAKIRSRDVYPGIDLVYYGTQGQLEYDFVLAPGADPSRIRMTFAGAAPAVNASGDLVLPLGGRDIRFRKPVLYQDIDGVRKPVSGRFSASARSHEVAFQVDSYNPGRELTIDPVLAYSSYFGGPAHPSQITAITLNAAGDIYLTGWTLDVGFPTTLGVIEPTCPSFPSSINPGATYSYGCKFGAGENGSNSAFVSKISADGQTLLYSTFLGGAATGTNVDNIQTNNDYGTGIAVDSGDNAWVVGTTGSNDFPITPSTAFQPDCDPQAPGTLFTPVFGSYCGASNYAVFLVQLNPTGTTELYGTFVNGTGWSIGGAQIALDRSGDIYVAGTVYNPNPTGYAKFVPFPSTASAYQTTSPGTNFSAFVTEFAPGGRTLIYSTVLGGMNQSASTFNDGLAVAGGKIFISGGTSDPTLPTTAGALSRSCVRNQPGDQTCSGNATQAYVAEFDPTKSGGASLVFSTYLNGSTLVHGDESSQAFALAADSAGAVYAAGFTTYSAADGFPATPGTLQSTCVAPVYGECATGFVTKLSQTGGLVWSTFYGSPTLRAGNGILTALAVDSSDNVYITGNADGLGDIPLNNGFQSYSSGVAYVTELNTSGSQVLFGAFYGGGADIYPNTLALDASNNIYFAGYTANNLPLVNPLQSANSGGNSQGFFAKISNPPPGPAAFVSAASSQSGTVAAGSIVSAYGVDLATGTASAATTPLPMTLAGTSVNIVDSTGVVTPAPLFFVASGQVNFLVPLGLANGSASINIASGDGKISSGKVTIATVAPGLFTVNSAGLVAADVITVNTDGTQVSTSSYQVVNGGVVPLPVNLSPPAQVVLVLYGTGISGASSVTNVSVSIAGLSLPVLYAGPQGGAGLDQVNVQLPSSLAGSGDTILSVVVDGVVSNSAHITIM